MMIPMKKHEEHPISEVLRRAVVESGISHLRLEQETGLSRGSIARFVNRQTDLYLESADKLARYFGIEARQSGQRKNR